MLRKSTLFFPLFLAGCDALMFRTGFDPLEPAVRQGATQGWHPVFVLEQDMDGHVDLQWSSSLTPTSWVGNRTPIK